MNSTQEPLVRPPSAHAGRRLSWAMAFVLVMLILALLGGFIYYRIETLPMRTAKQVQDIFSEVAHVQPKITVQNRVIFQQASKVMELAVLTRDLEIEHDMSEQWLGSKKGLRLRGVYRVRAGFDLTKPFNVTVNGTHVLAEVPSPKVLSVDQVDTQVLSHESGLWNKLRPEDVAGEMRQMPAEALRQSREAGIEREALQFLREQLVERFGSAYEVEVRVRHEAAGGI